MFETIYAENWNILRPVCESGKVKEILGYSVKELDERVTNCVCLMMANWGWAKAGFFRVT